MKIALLTLGTRGDVQPYLALSKGLIARGHDVILAAPENFGPWIKSHNVPFFSIGIDFQEILQSPETKRIAAGNWSAIFKIWRSTVIPLVKQSLAATWEAGRDADILLYHPKIVGAVDVAEATGAIAISASPIPMLPTGDFPFLIWTRPLGRVLNRLTYGFLYISRLPYLKHINRWRREVLGLGRGPVFPSLRGRNHDGRHVPALCAVSPAVLPRPKDWDTDIHLTGYWFLDETDGGSAGNWEPDPDLARFLNAGPPPVYIGFGSMTSRDPAALARTVVEGVGRAGVRAILATGWGGLEEVEVPDAIHVIDSAPHELLFKHVSAVVHHGGAGTTAAGLRAGRPTLVCPMAVDQPFWGRRVWKLGCGPKPQSLRRLTADGFSKALSDLVRTDSYRTNAERVAATIETENGIEAAIQVIEAAGSSQESP